MNILLSILPYMAKYWWDKILVNLANRSHVAKIDPTKIWLYLIYRPDCTDQTSILKYRPF